MKRTSRCPRRAGNLRLSGQPRQVSGHQFLLADPFREVQAVTMQQQSWLGQPRKLKNLQEACHYLGQPRRAALAIHLRVDRPLLRPDLHLDLEPGRFQRRAQSLHHRHLARRQVRQVRRGPDHLPISSAHCRGLLRSQELVFLAQARPRGHCHQQRLYRLQRLAWVLHQQHLQEPRP